MAVWWHTVLSRIRIRNPVVSNTREVIKEVASFAAREHEPHDLDAPVGSHDSVGANGSQDERSLEKVRPARPSLNGNEEISSLQPTARTVLSPLIHTLVNPPVEETRAAREDVAPLAISERGPSNFNVLARAHEDGTSGNEEEQVAYHEQSSLNGCESMAPLQRAQFWKIRSSVSSYVFEVKILGLDGNIVATLAPPCFMTVADLKRHLSTCDELQTPASRLRLVVGGEGDGLADHVILDTISNSDQLTLTRVRLPPRSIEPGGRPDQSYDSQFRTVLLGDANCGRTAILSTFVHDGDADSRSASIGTDYKIKSVMIDGGTCVQIQLWDTAGQERLRTIIPACYQVAHCFIVVFDVTNRSSFENVPMWLEKIRRHGSANALVAVFGNTGCDVKLVDACDETRQVSYDEASTFAAGSGLVYYEAPQQSVKDVEMMFYDELESWLSRSCGSTSA